MRSVEYKIQTILDPAGNIFGTILCFPAFVNMWGFNSSLVRTDRMLHRIKSTWNPNACVGRGNHPILIQGLFSNHAQLTYRKVGRILFHPIERSIPRINNEAAQSHGVN